ncbi:hypothetical protein [Niabella aquatica]
MIRYIRNNIITIRQAIGIDIHFLNDGKMTISGVQIKAAKSEVQKVSSFDRIHSVKDLKSKLPKNIPVAATLNGKGILMRTNSGKATDSMISTLFPGANPQDFVYTIHDIEGDDNVIFIARKSFVEDTVKELNGAGVRLVALTLGSNPVNILLPFMHKWSTDLITPMLRLDINEKKVVSVKPEDDSAAVYKEIEIGGALYNTNKVLALGAALGLLSKPADRLHSDIRTTEINYLQKDYVYFKLFQFTGWAILITTLSLLLVNFFVFNHYFNKNKELVQANDLLAAQMDNSSDANRQLDSSYNFFMRSGWNKTSRHGYYIDRIAALVPASVSLSNMQTAPLQESIGVNDYIFTTDKILVSGTSIDPTELETFSRSVKNITGVAAVAIKSYFYKSEIKAAIFTIEITVSTSN